MKLTTGIRLSSQVCSTQVVVIKAPTVDVELTCGGQPLVPLMEAAPQVATQSGDFPRTVEGNKMGKRYITASFADFELLVTKPGDGLLELNGEPVAQKEAKPLPASD